MANLSKIIYVSDSTDPTYNLALEEYFMSICRRHEVYLFLYCNDPCIVIGKHQNPYNECDVLRLRESGIPLIRRLSGGGTVYHDLGNLNYSFITHPVNYSVNKHLETIIMALKSLGIKSYAGERHDLWCNERKISGSAFIHKKVVSCHHGTLLLNANLENLRGILKPSNIAIMTKGIASVPSPVINLRKVKPELTMEQLQIALVETFNSKYLGQMMYPHHIDLDYVDEHMKKYTTDQWNYVETPKYQILVNLSGPKYDIELSMLVRDGYVAECDISQYRINNQALSEEESKRLIQLIVALKLTKTSIDDLALTLNSSHQLQPLVGYFKDLANYY